MLGQKPSALRLDSRFQKLRLTRWWEWLQVTPQSGKQAPEADGAFVLRSFNVFSGNFSLGNLILFIRSRSLSPLGNALSVNFAECEMSLRRNLHSILCYKMFSLVIQR